MRCTQCKEQPGAPTTVMHQGTASWALRAWWQLWPGPSSFEFIAEVLTHGAPALHIVPGASSARWPARLACHVQPNHSHQQHHSLTEQRSLLRADHWLQLGQLLAHVSFLAPHQRTDHRPAFDSLQWPKRGRHRNNGTRRPASAMTSSGTAPRGKEAPLALRPKTMFSCFKVVRSNIARGGKVRRACKYTRPLPRRSTLHD